MRSMQMHHLDMPRRKLRPIDETRLADGRMTSETAARLLRRRGGLASAKKNRLNGFENLKRGRLKSLAVRTAMSLQNGRCKHCGAMSGRLAELSQRYENLVAALLPPRPEAQLTADELAMINGTAKRPNPAGVVRPPVNPRRE
jgi:hypothetical protein